MPQQRQDDEVHRHEERRRIDERHVGAEGQLSEREEPDGNTERTENRARDVAHQVRRFKRQMVALHKEPDGDDAEKGSVKDHLQRCQLTIGELHAGGHH